MRRGALISGTVVLLLLIGTVAVTSNGDTIERRPIVITNNYEFTAENGVTSGAGTVDDPYIIEGWKIDAGYSDYGIRIYRTDRAFIIRNVEISGAAKAAISLSYVRNAYIEDCTLVGNWIGITLSFSRFNRISRCTLASNTDGIHFYFSHDNQMLQNTLEKNDTAIWLDASNDNEIIGNVFRASHMGIYLDLGSEGNLVYHNAFLDNLHNAHSVDVNRWDENGEGNYWFDYRAIDADEDGVWDSPYVIRSDGDQDNFPLVNRPKQTVSPKVK
jgi:parallel beta-helix repeat protein